MQLNRPLLLVLLVAGSLQGACAARRPGVMIIMQEQRRQSTSLQAFRNPPCHHHIKAATQPSAAARPTLPASTASSTGLDGGTSSRSPLLPDSVETSAAVPQQEQHLRQLLGGRRGGFNAQRIRVAGGQGSIATSRTAGRNGSNSGSGASRTNRGTVATRFTTFSSRNSSVPSSVVLAASQAGRFTGQDLWLSP